MDGFDGCGETATSQFRTGRGTRTRRADETGAHVLTRAHTYLIGCIYCRIYWRVEELHTTGVGVCGINLLIRYGSGPGGPDAPRAVLHGFGSVPRDLP